jgi:hypothetical protein
MDAVPEEAVAKMPETCPATTRKLGDDPPKFQRVALDARGSIGRAESMHRLAESEKVNVVEKFGVFATNLFVGHSLRWNIRSKLGYALQKVWSDEARLGGLGVDARSRQVFYNVSRGTLGIRQLLLHMPWIVASITEEAHSIQIPSVNVFERFVCQQS